MNLPKSISRSFSWFTTARVGLLAQAALVALVSGCGAADGPVTFTELKPLIRTSCALSSSCHGSFSANTGNLFLIDSEAYCQLVGPTQGATYRQTAKAQFPHRVVAKDKVNSFLYQKLILPMSESGPTKPLGAVMPLYQPLDSVNIELFARWIDGGAQNDSGTPAPANCN